MSPKRPAALRPRPALDWPTFLAAAPHFQTALWRAPGDWRAFAPWPRAAMAYDQFDGQVSNGGVMQYFYNCIGVDPALRKAHLWVAEHPALHDAAAMMAEVHARWDEVCDEVRAARRGAAALSDRRALQQAFALFKRHARGFAAFEKRFCAAKPAIAMRLIRHMLEHPGAYIDFLPLPATDADGTVDVEQADGTRWRLRVVDGFAVGPNLRFGADGEVGMLRFTSDRLHLDYDAARGGGEEPARAWVDFRSGQDERRSFERGALSAVDMRRDLRREHGLRMRFAADGAVIGSELSLHGRAVAKVDHGDDGRPRIVRIAEPDGTERVRCYFDKVGFDAGGFDAGGLNVEWIAQADGRRRFVACLDERGNALIVAGEGALREAIAENVDDEGRQRGPRWRLGTVRGGFLHGEARIVEGRRMIRTETYADGVPI